jgi:hypothetical protein
LPASSTKIANLPTIECVAHAGSRGLHSNPAAYAGECDFMSFRTVFFLNE